MTWPFENDTSAVVRRLSDARLRQSRFRNNLIGIIIFMSAAIMAFVSSYAYNIVNDYAASTAHHGISADNIQVNNLYIDSNNMSKETIFTVLLVGMVLIGVCSLVVYNIFFISVMNDVISFGQLRTLGTTKKQIKRIISKEGNCLALRFIPFGCVAGGMLSFLIDRDAFLLIPNIIIVLLSGAAVFVCVRLSILKPAKIAMAVSPMEAFRYTCYDGIKKTRKSRKHLTPFSLAAMNLLRNRKRSILTFASLILSGMLFVGMSSLMTSLNPVQRAKQSFPYEGDYVIELNRALVTPSFSLTELQEDNFLTDGLKQEILSIDGVEGIVCQQEICVVLDGTETAIRSMNAEDHNVLEEQVLAGVLPEFDHTGENTLVVNLGSPELEYLQKSYEVGDTVTFSQFRNGLQDSFTYVVVAVIFDKNSASSFILPAGEMNRIVPYNANSAFVIQADSCPEIERELYSLVSVNDALRLKTLKDMTMQYKSVFSTISAAAYALLAVVIMFSIINLVNTSITNIISRRKELGLFRVVGLDNKQLCHMIGIEIAFQTLGSFAASVVCGLFIGKAICAAVGNIPGFSFVEYSFPAVSVLFYGLLIFMLQISLTKWAGLYCKKTTVVEQLRAAE